MTPLTPLAAYILLFIAVGVGFIFVHLVAGKLIRPSRPDAEKGTIYECGEPTIGSAWIQFDLRFYVVALLFVIFDVEVAFFFPWAEVFGKANAIVAISKKPESAAEYREYAEKVLDLAAPAISSKLQQEKVAPYEEMIAKQPRPRLTNESFRACRDAEVPEAVLAKLSPLRDKEYKSPEELRKELAAVLNKNELDKYKAIILSQAETRLAWKLDDDELKRRLEEQEALRTQLRQNVFLQKAAQDRSLSQEDRAALKAAIESGSVTPAEESLIEKSAIHALLRKLTAGGPNQPPPAMYEGDHSTLKAALQTKALTPDIAKLIEKLDQFGTLQRQARDNLLTPPEQNDLKKAKASKEPTPEEKELIDTLTAKSAEHDRLLKIANANALTVAEETSLQEALKSKELTQDEKDTLTTAAKKRETESKSASLLSSDGLLKAGEFEQTRDDARALSRVAFFEVLIFFGVLLVGFAYLWRRGDLAWVRSTAAEQTPPSSTAKNPIA